MKPAVYTVNVVLPGTVVVDGFFTAPDMIVRTRSTGTRTVTQRLPHSARDRMAPVPEADALLAWAAPELTGAIEMGDAG